MKYRYYVHNNNENVGVTEFSSEIWNTFIECLCDCLDWFMWESDETCFYEFTVFINEDKLKIKFDFDEEDEMYAEFILEDINDKVSRYYVRDYVKANL